MSRTLLLAKSFLFSVVAAPITYIFLKDSKTNPHHLWVPLLGVCAPAV
jgi:hypothetical protein